MSDLMARLAQLSPQQRTLLQASVAQRNGAPAQVAQTTSPPAPESTRPLSFSVFFFSDDAVQRRGDPYRLVLEAAKFADRHDFEAIWFPERHFHEFGGLYANPSVLAAAIAMVTSRIRIRAGSVVVPLHHPARVAEEWAMVDNLSGGRVDISAASGWVREDFALSGVDFGKRREETFSRLRTIRALWRGERANVQVSPAVEPLELRAFPRPVQPELNVWITTAGTAETWVRAGEQGYNVLSGLLQSTLEQTADNIRAYRQARAAAGHDPDAGRVTLMMHTFIDSSVEQVRQTVHDPLVSYLKTHLNLYESLASIRDGLPVDAAEFSADDKAALAEFAFERYFTGNGLFGTPQTCLEMTGRLQAIGVDEVACLIDFGVDDEIALQGLAGVDELRRAVQERIIRNEELEAAP